MTRPASVRAKAPNPVIFPAPVTLPDGRKATIYGFFKNDELNTIERFNSSGERVSVPDEKIDRLVTVMWTLFNEEIDRGQTYPQEDQLSFEDFKNYWFTAFVAVMLLDVESEDWEFINVGERFLGTFYIKSNYPGRCGHVCNAGFLVSMNARGQGVGMTLGKQYVVWAPQLGYLSSIFNLVFETNLASQRIWDRLGFTKVGRVRQAAFIKGEEGRGPVDAIIYEKVF